MVTETIELSPELDTALQSIAERTGRPKHALMVELLEQGLALPRRETGTPATERLHSLGAVSIPGVHAADNDAWLTENWRPDEEWGRDVPTVK